MDQLKPASMMAVLGCFRRLQRMVFVLEVVYSRRGISGLQTVTGCGEFQLVWKD